MDLGLGELQRTFERLAPADQIVLASVVETRGSTYRKPGAMMLIESSGLTHGLLSGGCLEGDLAEHATSVLATGQPSLITYDMLSGEEPPWGLGLGCQGLVRVLLTRIDANDPVFTRLCHVHARRQRAMLLQVFQSDLADWQAGSLMLADGSGQWFGVPQSLEAKRLSAALPTNRPDRAVEIELDTPQGRARLLLVPIDPPRRLLVLGAGPDAVPLVRLAQAIGWDVDVADHRPAYIEQLLNKTACRANRLRPDQIDDSGLLARADAVVIMSHHLEHDRAWIARVAEHPVAYIGLLGPAARRERVLEDIPETHHRRIHGPAGLDLGAELPETIALSILAEAHAMLNDRDGRPLSS
ncbi:MAG: XdhC family protein [Pseudomonadota bacterium]|nr:MAG: XdhC family protein [Pseudomonadota bacterium]